MEQFVNNLGIVTEVLLYLNFAILMGGLILVLVPEKNRPAINTTKKLLVVSILLIPILSFTPLLEVIILLSKNMSLAPVIHNILFTFEIGKGWLFTVTVSVVLFILVLVTDLKQNKPAIRLAIFLTILLTFAAGYSSHASSITDWVGFISHSFHFLAVTVWVGIVIYVGWFSYNHQNWPAFLKWFSPLALISVVILLTAGFITMKIDINSYIKTDATLLQEYKDSLVINYGQALLIKHLFVIPLLVCAYINSVLIKRKLKQNEQYNPIKWIRVESVFMILVLIATALLGQDYPPHQVTQLVKTGGFSSLFEWVNQNEITLPIHVVFDYKLISYLLFIFSFVSAGLMVLFSVRRKQPFWAYIFGLIFVICSYIGIVIGIQS